MNKMRCPINQIAENMPHEPAIVGPENSYTWRQYDSCVSIASRKLRSLGIAEGTRVAVCEPNSVPLIIAIMALFRVGAVVCPLSTRLPVDGREEALRQCGADIFLSLDGSVKSTGVRTFVIGDLVAGDATKESGPTVECDRAAAIIFTTGSSATPKAVLLSYDNLWFNALGSNQNIPFDVGSRWLLSLPLYHVGGLGILFRSIVGGGAVVVPRDTNNIVDTALRAHTSHLSLVSTQLIRFLEAFSAGTPHQLKAILLGGSAIPGFLIRAAHALGLPLFTSYGLTEMGSQVTTTIVGDPLERLMTSGKLLNYREIRCRDDGEILVRGTTRFLGYVNGKDTTTPVDDDGWFHTGDLGSIDPNGYLHVSGRKDNMFVSGGENIQPEEIERLLTQLEFVMDAVVVPVADSEFGYRPAAFVRTLDGRPLDERYVVMHLERFIPRFKIPDYFMTLPEASLGMKIDRKMLTAIATREVGR